jgi:PleD family two-component response regulator
MNICIKRRREQQKGRRESDEPTHWVELPKSSHLPVDIDASDPPQDRMNINKRPTADTMGNQDNRSPIQSPESIKADPKNQNLSELPVQHEEGSPSNNTPDPHKRSVLLVDDNNVNLQLLCAYAQKDGFTYKSASDGAQAVELFKADPGGFQAIVIGMFSYFFSFLLLIPRSPQFSFHQLG